MKPEIIHAQDVRNKLVDMTYYNIRNNKGKNSSLSGTIEISKAVQYMLFIFLGLNILRITGIIKQG